MPSDALAVPLTPANKTFLVLFFGVSCFLMQRWREKVRVSVPQYLLNVAEIFTLFSLLACFSYLLRFFGIRFMHYYVVKGDAVESHSGKRRPEKFEDGNGKFKDENEKGRDQNQKIEDQYEKGRNEKLKEQTGKFGHQNETVNDGNAMDSKGQGETKPFQVWKGPGLSNPRGLNVESDEELAEAVASGEIASHSLESRLGNCFRAAAVRRRAVEIKTGRSLEGLGFEGFDYDAILGHCCEMPVGFLQIPVGVVGPLDLDGAEYFVPLATTEGCLVASANRGCKAITVSGGARSFLLKDGMTRAPVLRFQSAKRAAEVKHYVEDPKNLECLAVLFNRTSRFARLQDIQCALAGRTLYMRFRCSTGDAMGMNMVSKGVHIVLDYLSEAFPDMDVVSISGNFCADKKPTAVNWIEGRGKSVVCEAMIKKEIVKDVLKTSVGALIELNTLKNLAGSAMAGALGGYNAHAANIVSAIFIATGQDPAQNVESSHCITMIESTIENDLHISVTMPCIEVGTVGGGTHLSSQAACLDLLGVKGANMELPGVNAQNLARIVAGAVLAGELSLMSALAAGHLVKSHMKYNRSANDISSVPKAAF